MKATPGRSQVWNGLNRFHARAMKRESKAT